MVGFSREMLGTMGFVREGHENVIRATFELLIVFEISGIKLEDEEVLEARGAVAEVDYRLSTSDGRQRQRRGASPYRDRVHGG